MCCGALACYCSCRWCCVVLCCGVDEKIVVAVLCYAVLVCVVL